MYLNKCLYLSKHTQICTQSPLQQCMSLQTYMNHHYLNPSTEQQQLKVKNSKTMNRQNQHKNDKILQFIIIFYLIGSEVYLIHLEVHSKFHLLWLFCHEPIHVKSNSPKNKKQKERIVRTNAKLGYVSSKHVCICLKRCSNIVWQHCIDAVHLFHPALPVVPTEQCMVFQNMGMQNGSLQLVSKGVQQKHHAEFGQKQVWLLTSTFTVASVVCGISIKVGT